MADKSSTKRYVVSVRGGVRRTTIGLLTPKVAKTLSKIEPDDDEDMRDYVEDVDDAFFAYAVCAEAFAISVSEQGSNKVLFSTNQDDVKLKKEIKEMYIEKPGVYVSTTQNERGHFGAYELTIPSSGKFDPALLSVVGVWPRDTAAGPLITEVYYDGVILSSDEDYETDVSAFQVDFFEVEPLKAGSKKQKRSDLTLDEAITKSKK